MLHRVWAALRWAARSSALGLGAAVASLGSAELIAAQAEPADLDAYARKGIEQLEAWLARYAIPD